MDFGKLFFSAYGRIGRQEFWIGWVILLMVGIFTCFIPVINFIVWCGLLYCGICIRSKRLHDMGRSGWLQVIPVVAKVVFAVIGFYLIVFGAIAGWMAGPVAVPGIALGIATLVFSAIAAWLVQVGFLLWIGVSQGDPLDNQYGPAPDYPPYRMGAPA
jgi:uncharacterized membrane protein YhaH (DUF805 family)